MTPEQIQEAFVSQLEFNRQLAEQTAENSQVIQAISRDLAQLVTTQQAEVTERQALRVAIEQTSSNVDRLTNITDRFIDITRTMNSRLEQNISELRAGQEQQSRVLDQLLRQQQDRQNED